MMKLVENKTFIKNVRDFLLAKLYGMHSYELNRENANLLLEGALMLFKDANFVEHLQECIICYSSLDKKDSMSVVNAIDEIVNVLTVDEEG